MSPLTRARSGRDGVPTEINVLYYGQRASMGLILSEGVNISPAGCSFERPPGIWTAAQVAGWRAVTNAVYEKGAATNAATTALTAAMATKTGLTKPGLARWI
jgi:N-ethylmaleimide reductase